MTFARILTEPWSPVDDQVSVENGTHIYNFEEYTFRAFRPGYFLGDDPRTKDGLTSGLPQVFLTEKIVESDRALSLLGSLNRLPIEILIEILPTLDLPSLISFRNTNMRARNIVDSIAMFRRVVSFPRLIGAVLQLRCKFFDLNTLYTCINNSTCSFCGQFGDMLYLITCERWCFDCWQSRETAALTVPREASLEPLMTDIEAREKFGHIPHVFLSPGTYGLDGNAVLNERALAFDQRSFFAQQDAPPWKPLTTTSWGAHPLNFVAVIRAPYFESLTKEWHEGFMCCACSFQGWRVFPIGQAYEISYDKDIFSAWEAPWRRYTQEGMQQHIEQHGRILRVEKSGWGKRYVHELPLNSHKSNPAVLREMSEILRQCRDKVITFPPPQLYCPRWRGVWSHLPLKPLKNICKPT